MNTIGIFEQFHYFWLWWRCTSLKIYPILKADSQSVCCLKHIWTCSLWHHHKYRKNPCAFFSYVLSYNTLIKNLHQCSRGSRLVTFKHKWKSSLIPHSDSFFISFWKVQHQLFMQVLSCCHHINIPVLESCQEAEILQQRRREREREREKGLYTHWWSGSENNRARKVAFLPDEIDFISEEVEEKRS